MKRRRGVPPTVVLEGTGSILEPQKSKTFVLIPQPVRKDSAFPFERGERVAISVDPVNRCIIISKLPKNAEAKKKGRARPEGTTPRRRDSAAEKG